MKKGEPQKAQNINQFFLMCVLCLLWLLPFYGSVYTYKDSFRVGSGSVMPPPPDAVIATYCLPFFAWYVIGTAIALLSSFVAQSSFPVLASNARKRLSFVAPMNTTPPAVAMEPPILMRPVFFFPSGSSSVTPNVTCHAISPVF